VWRRTLAGSRPSTFHPKDLTRGGEAAHPIPIETAAVKPRLRSRNPDCGRSRLPDPRTRTAAEAAEPILRTVRRPKSPGGPGCGARPKPPSDPSDPTYDRSRRPDPADPTCDRSRRPGPGRWSAAEAASRTRRIDLAAEAAEPILRTVRRPKPPSGSGCGARPKPPSDPSDPTCGRSRRPDPADPTCDRSRRPGPGRRSTAEAAFRTRRSWPRPKPPS